MLSTALSIAAGVFLSEFLDAVIGLEAAARAMAEWWREHLPTLRYVEAVET